jgi:CubicO group peptidase (beta-lactamase class C family)
VPRFYFLPLLFSLFSSPILAAPPPAPAYYARPYVQTHFDQKLNQLRQALTDLQARGLLDGEVLIARGDTPLLHLKSQDLGAIENPQFMIGSVSKQFFAVALLKALYDAEANPQLTEEQRVSYVKQKLRTPISHFLPEQAPIWAGHMPRWAHTVTLHQLLTHTSGIPNYFEGFSGTPEGEKGFFEKEHKKSEILQLIARQPLQFPPGSHFAYSNTGYLLIAEVIEAVTKMPVADTMQQAIFTPSDLKNTHNPDRGSWGDLKKTDDFSQLAPQWEYDPTRRQLNPYPPAHSEDLSIATGAASIISTSSDLLKWNHFLHKEHAGLPNSLYTLLITPHLENYAYGIQVQNFGGELVLGHQGTIGTYNSHLLYFPKRDLTVIVLSHVNYDMTRVEHEFEHLYSELSYSIPNGRERNEVAMATLLSQYPGDRGFIQISEFLRTLVT